MVLLWDGFWKVYFKTIKYFLDAIEMIENIVGYMWCESKKLWTGLGNQNDTYVRTKVQIPGSYMGKDGFFGYIIEPNGRDCNHRMFVPNK